MKVHLAQNQQRIKVSNPVPLRRPYIGLGPRGRRVYFVTPSTPWCTSSSKFYKTQTIAQKTPPQELFIERCLQMLKTSGKMAIILPESYLHAPSKRYVLQYLTEKKNIQTIIDLPQNTFHPFCGVKTCLVIVQKTKVNKKIL